MSGTVTYDSNNSGGYWWLDDQDWYALETAGWAVGWFKASKTFASLGDGIAEWERLTGESPNALGCSCCGVPHSFEWEGADGRHEYWSPTGIVVVGDSYISDGVSGG